jgi:hypothetical protein
MEDRVETSSGEALTAQALVARSRSTTSNDNLINDDLDLLKFNMAKYEIVCQTNSWLQRC